MSWNVFWIFALVSVLLWLAGSLCALYGRKRLSEILVFAGLLVFAAFIAGFWASLGRPPLRTSGETRLWYSFFTPPPPPLLKSRQQLHPLRRVLKNVRFKL